MTGCTHALPRFDEELAAFAVNLPGGVGEFYLRPAPVRRADTRRVPMLRRCTGSCGVGAMLARCARSGWEVGRAAS